MNPAKIIKPPRIRIKPRMRDFGVWWSDGSIDIRGGLRPKTHLKTLLHELMHHYNPDWSEKRVERVAQQMGEIIWNQRYRRLEDKQ